MHLQDVKFPTLEERELEILTRRHQELKDQKNLNTVEKLEFFLALGLVTATTKDKKPFKTALDAWSVIWISLLSHPEWKKRNYDETAVCFRVAATNVLKLIG